MYRLDGKAVLITGAGSGIGQAAAKVMAAEGARVLIAISTGCSRGGGS